MKTSIVAQNGSLHFDDNEDIELIETFISAKNIWTAVGGDHVTFPKSAKIIAIHVVGKNTAASPTIYLSNRDGNYDAGTFGAEGRTILNQSFIFNGMIDINWLIKSDNFNDFTTAYLNTIFQLRVDNASAFTGNLFFNIYVSGRR